MFQLRLLLIDSFHRETFVRFFLVLWGPCMINHCQILFDDSFLTWQKFFFDDPPAPLYSSSDILGFSSHESCRTCWKIIFGWVWVVRASFLTLSGLVKGAKVRVARSRDILVSYRRSLLTANYYCFVPSLDCRLWGWREKGSGWPQVQVEPDFAPGGKVEMRRSTSGKAEPASPPTNFGKKEKNLKCGKTLSPEQRNKAEIFLSQNHRQQLSVFTFVWNCQNKGQTSCFQKNWSTTVNVFKWNRSKCRHI